MTSSDSDLLRQTAALSKKIEPERDLWPLIKAQLDESDHPTGELEAPPSRTRAWQAPLAIAASLVLALGVGFWVGSGSRTGIDGQSLAESTRAYQDRSSTQAVNLIMAADLRQTRLLLSRDIEATLGRLPEDARVVVRENLAAINQALDEIDQVLGRVPESTVDRQLLMTMYADQLTLLGSMQRVIRTSNNQDMNQEILL